MAKELELTRGLKAIVDDDVFEWASRDLWFAVGHVDSYFYASRRIGRRKVYLHRIITEATPREVVDHVSGDTLDNRRCNLRVCTQALNLANQKKRPGSSRYRGVRKGAGGKWRADICIRGVRTFLGHYATEEEAAIAWNQAALVGWGSFARLNEVTQESMP